MNCKIPSEKRTSTLPPPCCHRRPPPFFCPENGCPPFNPAPPILKCQQSSPPLLVCRMRPVPAPPRPTICIAKSCPESAGVRPYSCPPPPKLTPPSSSVKFCIRYTCQGTTYFPCYTSGIPTCN